MYWLSDNERTGKKVKEQKERDKNGKVFLRWAEHEPSPPARLIQKRYKRPITITSTPYLGNVRMPNKVIVIRFSESDQNIFFDFFDTQSIKKSIYLSIMDNLMTITVFIVKSRFYTMFQKRYLIWKKNSK